MSFLSIINPSSLFELSCQVNFTSVWFTKSIVKFLGAFRTFKLLSININSMPSSYPRLREYCLSILLFQCSFTPNEFIGIPSFSGS